jgi:Recombinase
MQAAKARGVKLGGTTAKSIANRDEALARAEQLRPILGELVGKSHRAIAAELNTRGIATPSGAQWSAVTVKRVLERLERPRDHPRSPT